jgi:RNA polymerase sigma-70 factor (ECF subfamily)
MLGPGAKCRDSRLLLVRANGAPAVAQWRRREDGPGHVPWALHVLEVDGDRIRGITSFLDLDSRLFARLGLPEDPPDRA